VFASLVLAGLVVAAGVSATAGWRGVVVLAALSVCWFAVNKWMEGPVLLVLGPGRGLSGADLAGLAGLGLAAYRASRLRQDTSSG
jgi:hypothetical protein